MLSTLRVVYHFYHEVMCLKSPMSQSAAQQILDFFVKYASSIAELGATSAQQIADQVTRITESKIHTIYTIFHIAVFQS